MAEFDTFYSIPSGSMYRVDDETWERLTTAFNALPPELLPVVNDLKIGAYMRGLTAANNLPVEKSADIAQVVLEVVTGLLPPTEMAPALGKRLGVDASLGERIAREIEKELLAPVALELNRYLQERAAGAVSEGIASSATPPRNDGSRGKLSSPTPTLPAGGDGLNDDLAL